MQSSVDTANQEDFCGSHVIVIHGLFFCEENLMTLKGLYQNVLLFFFLRQGFYVALEPVLELALIDQADLELTEILLFLPPEYWD